MAKWQLINLSLNDISKALKLQRGLEALGLHDNELMRELKDEQDRKMGAKKVKEDATPGYATHLEGKEGKQYVGKTDAGELLYITRSDSGDIQVKVSDDDEVIFSKQGFEQELGRQLTDTEFALELLRNAGLKDVDVDFLVDFEIIKGEEAKPEDKGQGAELAAPAGSAPATVDVTTQAPPSATGESIVNEKKCPKCGHEMTMGAPHAEGVKVQWECHNCGEIITEKRVVKEDVGDRIFDALRLAPTGVMTVGELSNAISDHSLEDIRSRLQQMLDAGTVELASTGDYRLKEAKGGKPDDVNTQLNAKSTQKDEAQKEIPTFTGAREVFKAFDKGLVKFGDTIKIDDGTKQYTAKVVPGEEDPTQPMIESERGDKYSPHVSGTCMQCGKPSKIAASPDKEFCSKECQDKYDKEHSGGTQKLAVTKEDASPEFEAKIKQYQSEANAYFDKMKIVPDQADIYDYIAQALSDEVGTSYDECMKSVEMVLGKLKESVMFLRLTTSKSIEAANIVYADTDESIKSNETAYLLESRDSEGRVSQLFFRHYDRAVAHIKEHRLHTIDRASRREFKSFTKEEWDRYPGAQRFDGDKSPFIGEIRFIHEAQLGSELSKIIIDKVGIHILTEHNSYFKSSISTMSLHEARMLPSNITARELESKGYATELHSPISKSNPETDHTITEVIRGDTVRLTSDPSSLYYVINIIPEVSSVHVRKLGSLQERHCTLADILWIKPRK